MPAEWPLIYTELRAESLLSNAACESKVWRLSNFDEFLIRSGLTNLRIVPRSSLFSIEPAFHRVAECDINARFYLSSVNIKCKYK